jgi:hypothetical protein
MLQGYDRYIGMYPDGKGGWLPDKNVVTHADPNCRYINPSTNQPHMMKRSTSPNEVAARDRCLFCG